MSSSRSSLSRAGSFSQEQAGVALYNLKNLSPGAILIDVREAYIVDEDQVDGRSTPPDTRDIALPNHKDEVSHIAIDIGGSLTKVVYFTRDKHSGGGRLNFEKFETSHIQDCITELRRLLTQNPSQNTVIMATGGGSYKYYDLLKEELGVHISQEEEMSCLIAGLDFFINKIPEEVFCYSEIDPMSFPERKTIYPCLLVNIGSGVSMLKVLGPNNFTRIGGSSLGGGTLWGLLSLLTDTCNFDEMLEMAEKGDNTNVDMLVGDIYGSDYARIGLKASTIASSFGKVLRRTEVEPQKQKRRGIFKSEDISRSLLYAISNNIGQIAYLQAQRYSLEHIYFGGSYIRGHPQTMHTLSYAINFWSKGEKTAYFLRHEGYLGAVGAFLQHQPNWLAEQEAAAAAAEGKASNGEVVNQ